jgi:hypothetical protein
VVFFRYRAAGRKKDSRVRIRIGDLGAMAAAQKQAAPDNK